MSKLYRVKITYHDIDHFLFPKSLEEATKEAREGAEEIMKANNFDSFEVEVEEVEVAKK